MHITKTGYILLFAVLAALIIALIVIIHNIEADETPVPEFIETCGSYPNDGVYVPAAYYDIQYAGGYNGSVGGSVKTEGACAKNCKEVNNCAGYIYNAGTCYLLDQNDVKKATYYCKHGTGLTVTPNFAKQYRANTPINILGHGYMKKKRFPNNAIVRGPSALEECLTLKRSKNSLGGFGQSAESVWENKSYKIPELEGLTLKDNYIEGGKCQSYCTSLGGYALPWCYTDMKFTDGNINNKESSWGFCSSGCIGFDCFDGNQSYGIPQKLPDGTGQCPNCTDPNNCNSCKGCTGGLSCEQWARDTPGIPAPSASNYYCLYTGTDSKDEKKCCAETNSCATVINAPASWSNDLKEIIGQDRRQLTRKTEPYNTPGSPEIPYPQVTKENLAGVCMREVNCKAYPRNPEVKWCSPGDKWGNRKTLPYIYDPDDAYSPSYGACQKQEKPVAPGTLCCTYSQMGPTETDPHWDGYPVVDSAIPEQMKNVTQTCRTQCTDLNITDPSTPLQHKWCITDRYYPAAELAGKKITFPIENDNFSTKGLNNGRVFWDWGYCKEDICDNKYAYSPSGDKDLKYPGITGT